MSDNLAVDNVNESHGSPHVAFGFDLGTFRRQLHDLFIDDGHGLYYLAFSLYSLWSWLNRTTLWAAELTPTMSMVEKIVQISVLLLLAVSFFRQKATKEEWALALLTLCVGFTVWQISDEGWLFWIIIFVVCGKGVRLLPLAVITLVTVLSVTVLSASLSCLGVIEDKIMVRGSNGFVRHAMGFGHPNSFGAALLVISISFAAVCWRKITVAPVMAALISAYLAAAVADSRATSLCLIVLSVLLPITVFVDKNDKVRECAYLLLFLFILMVAVSVYFTFFFDPSRAADLFLDRLLSGRLRLANTYYESGGLTALGYNYPDGPMYWTGGKEYNFVVDNLYAHVLLRYGLIAFLLFVIAMILLFVKAIRSGTSGVLLFGLGMFLIYGLSETLGCRVECNFFIVGLWTVLYRCPVGQFDGSADRVDTCGENSSNREELSFGDCIKSVCRFRGLSND